MPWSSTNIVGFTERPDPKTGMTYFVVAKGGYHCNVFLREDMNLLFLSQPPEEWTSRTPLTRQEIARETTRLREHCETRGLRIERVSDRSSSTPRVWTLEVLERDVGGGRAVVAVRNGYIIKDDLKRLGFRWTYDRNPHKEWKTPGGLDLDERRALARGINRACARVTVVTLECEYFPTGSLEVAPTAPEIPVATPLYAPTRGGGGTWNGDSNWSDGLETRVKNEQPTATTEPIADSENDSSRSNSAGITISFIRMMHEFIMACLNC